MLFEMADYLQQFSSQPRLLLFALASIGLTTTLASLHHQNDRRPRFLLTIGGLLLVMGYAVLLPARSEFSLPNLPHLNLVQLTFNMAWLSIGGGLLLSSLRSHKS